MNERLTRRGGAYLLVLVMPLLLVVVVVVLDVVVSLCVCVGWVGGWLGVFDVSASHVPRLQ